MAIAIVVEDGSGIDGANSYVTPAQAIEYAAQRGIILNAGDETAILLIKACDYLDAQTWAGVPTHTGQALSFPRIIGINTADSVASNAIPWSIAKAQMQLAMIASDGTELMPNSDGKIMTELKAGPVDIKWASNGGVAPPIFPVVNSMIGPWLINNDPLGGFANIRVVRG